MTRVVFVAAILCGLCLCTAAPITTAQTGRAVEKGESIRIAGGEFVMGTEPGRVDELMSRFQVKRRELFASELPAHRVTVAAFSIDRTEVTTSAFNTWAGKPFAAADADLPAAFVTWDEASAFCRAAGKRLPTEAEWEFAASNRGTTEFPWGDEMPDAARANWLGAGLGKAARVGSFPPDRNGLYDLAGNLWEFVQDEWKNDYSPASAESPGRRVIRGGSYGGSPVNLRARYRDSHPANGAAAHVGFRCAR